MIGYRFTEYIAPQKDQTPFDRLLEIFRQLLIITSGDVQETLQWMNEIDRQHNLTPDNYGMGDFIEEL